MKNELQYFNIEDTLGGNQSKLTDPIMRIAGCAAVTACDLCIFLTVFHNEESLYPYNKEYLSFSEYNIFIKCMKRYLKPRFGGITILKLYVDGLYNYLQSVTNKKYRISEFSGEEKVENAILEIKNKIDQKKVIPYLLLRHKNRKFKHLTWHWFLITGYEECADGFYVNVITYGMKQWLRFDDLWNTGFKKKGGMILIDNTFDAQ
ncbi:MAG: hypothetical protein ACRC7V_08225 [Lachnospiraceae bacterium]